MDYFSLIFFAIIALMVGRVLYGRMKYGSWSGSFLRGSIERTYGEVALSSTMATSQKLQVHTMRPADSGEPFIALVVTSKAPMAASMQPYKLTREQALELAGFLTQAATA